MKWIKNLIIIYIIVTIVYLIELYFSYLKYGWIDIWLYNSILILFMLSLITTFFIFFIYIIFFNFIFGYYDFNIHTE